jgi:mannosyltransferase
MIYRPSFGVTGWMACTARYLDEHARLATWVALIAVTLVAFLLRAPYLDAQSLWRDEVDVVHLSNGPLLQLVRDLTKVQHNGPLYYVLMRGWLRLAGAGEFALRYPSLGFGVLSVPLLYAVGSRLLSRRAALLAALLAAGSPFLAWYSQDAKMYALVAALTLAAVKCELAALATGRLRWWAAFVVAASLLLYTHILSALMIPVYLAALLLARPPDDASRRMGLGALGLLTLPYLPLAAWQLPLVWQTHDTGHPFYPLHQMLSLLSNLYSRGTALVGGWGVVAAFLFALLVGVFFAGETRPAAFRDPPLSMSRAAAARLFLAAWLCLPILLIYLISLRTPVFEPRYLIFTAPAFFLLAAAGLSRLFRLSRAAALLTLAVILAFSLLGLAVQSTRPIKSDFRAAAAYVRDHRKDGAPIMFQMPYIRRTFDYYFQGDYPALEGPWTNDDRAEAQVEADMRRLLNGHPEVWLVASESWLWDSRDLTRAWFQRQARLVQSARFVLVDVYHYDLSGISIP